MVRWSYLSRGDWFLGEQEKYVSKRRKITLTIQNQQWIKYIFFYLADSGGMFYLVHLLHYVHKSTRYIKAQHIQLSVTHTVKLFTNHSSVMSTHTHPISEKDRHKQQKIIYLKGGGGMNVCLHTGSKAAISSSRSSKTRWLTSARTSDNIWEATRHERWENMGNEYRYSPVLHGHDHAPVGCLEGCIHKKIGDDFIFKKEKMIIALSLLNYLRRSSLDLFLTAVLLLDRRAW